MPILEIGALSSNISTTSIKLLQRGNVLFGAGGRFKYRLLEPLATGNKAVISTVYKAEILSVGTTPPPAKWLVTPVFLALEST
jgi:hypothetical protein